MRTAIRLTNIAALLVTSPALMASAKENPDVVKGGPIFEGYGASTHVGSRRLFAWSAEVASRSTDLAAFVDVAGGMRRVSASRTMGYVGGFDAGTDLLVYQQVRRGESDLFLFDVGANERTALGELNDGHWQWNPAIDTHRGTTWVVYGVNRFGSPGAKWRFFLYNASTGERTLLAETTNRCGCLFPGTVAYPWVTWAVGEDATAWRYDIRTGEQVPLLPTDHDEYAVTVSPNGTAYVAQAGDRCGSNAALYRVDPDGTPTLVLSFRSGREPANLSGDFTGERDRIFFDRRGCRTNSSDILRLRRADTLPGPPADAPQGGNEGALRRSGASSGASPRTR